MQRTRRTRRRSGHRIVMLLENQPYPQDVRVRHEAESLVGAGHEVVVLAPRSAGQHRTEIVNGVTVRRFWLPQAAGTAGGYVREYLVAHAQLIPRGLLQLARGGSVVHLHNPPDTLFPVAVVARLVGRRSVFDLHDLAPELFEEKFGGHAGL